MKSVPRCLGILSPLVCLVLASSSPALVLDHSSHSTTSLSNEIIFLTGHSELHLSGSGDPIPGCTLHLNSEDSWVFLHAVPPSSVTSSLLSRFRISGTPAVANDNVRVVQYASGTAVIPQGKNFQPLEIFTARNFSGQSRHLRPWLRHTDIELGSFNDLIRSFTLKRGWMATFAQHPDGSGASQVFIAQDSDLEIAVLPTSLDREISFIRVFPWRWVGKKGSCDVDPDALDADWHYNWNISKNSAPDWEYVAIKQQPYWPGTNQDWEARQVNHLSGFNEPDNPVEDAYQNLSPQGSVDNAVARYRELVSTGLRVGAPAVTDGGTSWILDFMEKAEAAGIRIDYVPVHYYRSQWNNDPNSAANGLYNFLRTIHEATGKPIWVTEFNNGANWTDNAHDPTTGENRDVIQAMINRMDDTDWIERYAIYSNVEWFRRTHYDDRSLTPMGRMYREHQAPIGYRQEIPNTALSGNATFLFENNTRDSSGEGNVALTRGTPRFVTGRSGTGLSFDGSHDFLTLSPRLGDSNDFSFAAWVKWDGGGNWQRIFDLGNGGTGRYFFLTPNHGGNLRCAITTDGWSNEQRLNAPPLTPNLWTHVAVTLSGNTGKLFVNGILVDTNPNMTINPSEIGTEFNYLGHSQFAADPLFNGTLDDVRFRDFALPESTIAQLASGNPPGFTSFPTQLATANLPFRQELPLFTTGGSGPLTFQKIAGPGWLALAPDGSLFGTPNLADVGTNTFFVSVTDQNGLSDTIDLTVKVTAPDPIARYPFNNSNQNTLGPEAADLINGPTYINGRKDQALQFDGNNDHVLLPRGVASTKELTFAAWVRWDGGGSWQRIFDFGNGIDSYLFLTPRTSGNRMRFAIKNGGSEQVLETSPLPTGSWNHLALTIGNGSARLYLNGVLRAVDSTITLTPADVQPALNYLGKSQYSDPYFDGALDDVTLFPRILSAAEIDALGTLDHPTFDVASLTHPELAPDAPFESSIAPRLSGGTPPFTFSKTSGPAWLTVDPNGRLSGVPTPLECGLNHFIIQALDANQIATALQLTIPVSPPPGLFAHYQFQNNLLDQVGSHHATGSGAPVFSDGLFGKSLTFDGTDDHLRLPSGLVSSLTDVTFAIRYRWHGGAAWQRLFDFGNNTSEYLILSPSSSTSQMEFRITTGGSATRQSLTAPRSPINEWTHAAVTLSGNTGTLYLNGTAVDTQTITLNPNQIAPTTNYLGKSQWPDPLFKGEIDDFRIYDHALTAAEVTTLARGSAAESVESGYEFWATNQDFENERSAAPEANPDQDALPNVFEWLFGTNPLTSDTNPYYRGQIRSAQSLGLPGDDSYLTLTARLRKSRPRFNLIPQGATHPSLFAHPGSQNLARPLPAVDDGAFEILTWYFPTPVTDQNRAFLRLKVERP